MLKSMNAGRDDALDHFLLAQMGVRRHRRRQQE